MHRGNASTVKILFIVFQCMLISVGCLDYFTNKTVKVVGFIKLHHVDGTEVTGYTLDCQTGQNTYSPIIDGDVISLFGNDSVLFVKTYYTFDTICYQLLHSAGDEIKNVSQITIEKFEENFDRNGLLKYQFPPDPVIQK
jgi:hypothetical protein